MVYNVQLYEFTLVICNEFGKKEKKFYIRRTLRGKMISWLAKITALYFDEILELRKGNLSCMFILSSDILSKILKRHHPIV